jgi:hypothetical protein
MCTESHTILPLLGNDPMVEKPYLSIRRDWLNDLWKMHTTKYEVLVKKNKMINKYFVYYYQMLLKLIIK